MSVAWPPDPVQAKVIVPWQMFGNAPVSGQSLGHECPSYRNRRGSIHNHPDCLQIVRFHARRNDGMIRGGTSAGDDLQCS